MGLVIDFTTMPFAYWSDCTKISYLQRRILVHSIIYYEMNDSVLSDKDFDAMSQQLVMLQQEASTDEVLRSQYYYVFFDFDGSTGFDLCYRLTVEDREYLIKLAEYILRQYKKDNRKENEND